MIWFVKQEIYKLKAMPTIVVLEKLSYIKLKDFLVKT